MTQAVVFQMGTTLLNLTALSAMTVPVIAPKPIFRNSQVRRTSSSGLVTDVGYKYGEWIWGFITLAQRDQLRTYCPLASARVFFTTKTIDNSDAWKTYSGIVTWPEDEPRSCDIRFPFVLTFTRLVVQVV
jgi:hypothetical protein